MSSLLMNSETRLQTRIRAVDRSRFGAMIPFGRAIAIGLVVAGCRSSSPVEVADASSRSFSLVVGQELDIRLQSIGPGEYSSPPTLTGSAVRFISASMVGPFVPAGVTQVFRFRTMARGTTVIEIRHTGNNRAVNDTVTVHRAEGIARMVRGTSRP